MLKVVDNVSTQPSPVCCFASVPSIERVKPQTSGECKGASVVEPEPFMVHNVEDEGKAKACAGRHSPDASFPAFGKLKMQASEACHKRYAIFDRGEGKNTVIVHPLWLKSSPYQSSPEPSFAREAKCSIGGLQAFNSKSVEAMFGFCSSAALSPAGLEVPVYREARKHAKQVQQKMGLSNMAECSFLDLVNSHQAQNSKKDIMESGFPLDMEEESEEFHENTEEINALLSSDDELSSTGHSPSDASSNCSGTKIDHGNKIFGKKRSLDDCSLDEVDDADSGLDKPAPDHTFLNSRRFGSWLSLDIPIDNDHKDTFSGVQGSNTPCRGKKSSVIDISEHVVAKISQCESKQSSGTFGEGGLVDNSKRIKIKKNVQQLKNVIPGGDGLDMAGVLCRTIQYVKCLQNRLRDLESAREFERPKKQRAGPK